MIQLNSPIEGKVLQYDYVQQKLSTSGFVLGGNWDYDHGSFDRMLEDRGIYWLRLPFHVVIGRLDPSITDEKSNTINEVSIRFESPIILHHERRTTPMSSTEVTTDGGMFSQFQPPAVQDGPITKEWIDRAKQYMRECEDVLLGEMNAKVRS